MGDSVGRAPVEFRDLTGEEIDAVLLRNNVGRLAFAFHDRVDIQPIHYVYDNGWIYGRTSEGEKTWTLQHNQWVAFEVDEIDEVFSWRSVVVHATFTIIDPDESEAAAAVWEKAANKISIVVPQSFTDEDPVPFRDILFRMYVNNVRGREARPTKRPKSTKTRT
jgi:nitroimidazol reductase NimA-like FMN-containing flavoprotein (pyridoxamine 5'-phosphate oxidase superfamily)